jgi:hypothetical protein
VLGGERGLDARVVAFEEADAGGGLALCRKNEGGAVADGQIEGGGVGLRFGEPALMQARLGAPVEVRAGKQVFGGHSSPG